MDFCELLDASVENLLSEGGPTAHLFASGEKGGSQADAKLTVLRTVEARPVYSLSSFRLLGRTSGQRNDAAAGGWAVLLVC